jgi:hypothetical protein
MIKYLNIFNLKEYLAFFFILFAYLFIFLRKLKENKRNLIIKISLKKNILILKKKKLNLI